MVALKMAMDYLGRSEFNLDHILQLARALDFSSQGEMFSVGNMEKLCRRLLPSHSLSVDLSTNLVNLPWLVEVMSEALFLVPYDIGRQQEPCLQKGHQAHWCLVLGLVLVVDSGVLPGIDLQVDVDEDFPLLALARPGSDGSSQLPLEARPDFYLVVRQSKSRRLLLYEPSLLLASNSNLAECRQSQRGEGLKIPPSLQTELAGMMITIRQGHQIHKKTHLRGKQLLIRSTWSILSGPANSASSKADRVLR